MLTLARLNYQFHRPKNFLAPQLAAAAVAAGAAEVSELAAEVASEGAAAAAAGDWSSTGPHRQHLALLRRAGPSLDPSVEAAEVAAAAVAKRRRRMMVVVVVMKMMRKVMGQHSLDLNCYYYCRLWVTFAAVPESFGKRERGREVVATIYETENPNSIIIII